MNLLEGTLSLLLRDLSTTSSSQLSLSGSLVSLLLFLVGLDSSISLSLSGFWLEGTSLLDQLKGSTNNGSLSLDGLSGSLLSNLLSQTLLVVSSVQDGPRDSSWVLSLVEQRSRLGVLESEDLGVTTDKQSTSTWVDLGTRERINFNLHCDCMKRVSTLAVKPTCGCIVCG